MPYFGIQLTHEMPHRQLSLDGSETPIWPMTRRRPIKALSKSQQAVLQHIKEHGSVRPVDAGRILYETVGAPQSRQQYASADGAELLRRLMLRGLVHKELPGKWVAGPGNIPPHLRGSERRRHG